jgi:uncharacterized membrane protein
MDRIPLRYSGRYLTEASEPPFSPPMPAQFSRKSSWLGVAALVLGIITLVVAVGLLSYAAIRYAPIARATSISAGEGPSLTRTQEQVSVAVVHFKVLSLQLAFVLGIATFVLSLCAIGLHRGRSYASYALVVLSAAATSTIVMWMFGFPLFPRLGHGG